MNVFRAIGRQVAIDAPSARLFLVSNHGSLIKVVAALLVFAFVQEAFAVPQSLTLPDGRQFMADFPCSAATKRSSGIGGEAVAKTCDVSTDTSFCVFMIVEAKLDLVEYQRTGMAFLKEIHHQYAKSLDPAYVSRRLVVQNLGPFGPALVYDILRGTQAAQLEIGGYWIPSRDRLLRATVTCLRSPPPSLERARNAFLSSISLVQ